MEKRADLPPGLPYEHPTVSYWQDPPSDIADLRTSKDLPTTADYIIVGSGITGSCIAHNILCRHPNARVVMLEARQACSGATGRNGGHTKGASYRSFLDHEKEFGLEEAIKVARLEYQNIRATHAFAREHGIDCASTPCETVDIVYSQLQMDIGIQAIERMRETMGHDDPAAQYQIWSADETSEKFLCPDAVGSFQYEAGSLSAYAFTVGVLKLALDKGLNLQTDTPAESLHKRSLDGKTAWMIKTLRGGITAPHLILATNGYTAHLLPQTQGLIVPLHGQIVAQRPGSGLPQTGLATTYSFIQENGYEYMITRPPGSKHEGDVVIGGGIWQLPNDGESRYGNTDDRILDPTITDYLRQCTAGYFGRNWGRDHAEGRVRREWSGIMGATADGLPFVGAMPDTDGLWICAGFNGHGMVWCLKSAEALVDMLDGVAVDGWFPRPAIMSAQRMTESFRGRKDLRAPGESAFGERSRI